MLPALVALLVHLPIPANDYIYDDVRILTSERALSPYPPGSPGNVRLLTRLTYSLDRAVWTGWKPGPHLTNLLLHALATALAGLAARILSRSRRIALLTGLLFAIHPVHVEAVASVENRKDILAMIFVTLALVAWMGVDRPALRRILTGLALTFGILAKEAAVAALPAVLFLVELLWRSPEPARPLAGDRPPRWRAALPLLFMTAALAAGSLLFLRGRFAPASIYATTGGQFRSYGAVLRNSAAAIPDHLRLLLAPVRLSPDYPLPAATGGGTRAVAGIAILMGCVVAAFGLRRRSPLASFALIWPSLMLLPVANLLPLTEFFVAERYLYVPSFGVCLLVALVLDRLAPGQGSGRPPDPDSGRGASTIPPPGGWEPAAPRGLVRIRAAVLALLAILLLGGGALRSLARCLDWRDAPTLWTRALSAALLDSGDIDGAESACTRVLRVLPSDPGCRFLLNESGRRSSTPGSAGPSSALEGLATAVRGD